MVGWESRTCRLLAGLYAFRWAEHDKPWKGTPTPCDDSDKALFSACTTIHVGNGEIARFWSDKWLNGQAPCDIAPLLPALAARKNLSVKEALSNGRWMKGLQRMGTQEQLMQFLALWECIQGVSLSLNRDTIEWNLTASKEYSAASAYTAQFVGRMQQRQLEDVWRIQAEGKVKFFFWLLVQNRIWTADRLLARGWPHDDVCSLCDQELETANHLNLFCPYAKEVWVQFQPSYPAATQKISEATTVSGWWEGIRRGKMDAQRRQAISLSVYVFWHIWKERGRRIFQGDAKPASVLASMIKADLVLLAIAHAGARA